MKPLQTAVVSGVSKAEFHCRTTSRVPRLNFRISHLRTLSIQSFLSFRRLIIRLDERVEDIGQPVDSFRSEPQRTDNETPRATALHDVVFVLDLSTTTCDRRALITIPCLIETELVTRHLSFVLASFFFSVNELACTEPAVRHRDQHSREVENGTVAASAIIVFSRPPTIFCVRSIIESVFRNP